jgi:hypothetical protein
LVDVARGLISRRGGERIGVSIVALGEALASLDNKLQAGEISREQLRLAAERLGGYIAGGLLTVCVWGTGGASLFEVLARIQDRDNRLDTADLLIAATALNCSACRHLDTSDRKLVESEGLAALFHDKGKGIGEAVQRSTGQRRKRVRYGGGRRSS